MNRVALLALLVLAVIFAAAPSEAATVFVNWIDGREVYSVHDPQLYQSTVFTAGKTVGPNLPPIKGGRTVIIDVTDRTSSQIGYICDVLNGTPPSGYRYALRFTDSTRWIEEQLYTKGFITTTWNRIRGCIWDKKLKRTLEGSVSRYANEDARLLDDCWLNCDYEACLKIPGYTPPRAACECEEYQGRKFCHKVNHFTYSDAPDR